MLAPRGVGSALGGLGWARGVCAPWVPPAPLSRVLGVGHGEACKSRLGEGEQAGVQEGLQLTGLYQ